MGRASKIGTTLYIGIRLAIENNRCAYRSAVGVLTCKVWHWGLDRVAWSRRFDDWILVIWSEDHLYILWHAASVVFA